MNFGLNDIREDLVFGIPEKELEDIAKELASKDNQ